MIIVAVLTLVSAVILFVYTGGHSELSGHVEDIISDAVKLKFKNFKTRFHKKYANESAEQQGLVNFNDNLQEAYRRIAINTDGGIEIAETYS